MVSLGRRPTLDALQETLGVRFRDAGILRTALVHRSYLNESPASGLTSNERLEFLGDAVLGLVVARWLYRRYGDLPEGPLTEMRAALVRKETLAAVGQRLRLGDSLLLGRGEAQGGGRERSLNVARAFEAVVGAIAEDRGLATAERFIRHVLGPEFRSLTTEEIVDPKSRLQHLAQARWHEAPQYRVVAAEGPDHAKTFTAEVAVAGEVFGQGSGQSKRDAERAAARVSLAALAERGIMEPDAVLAPSGATDEG